MTHLGHENTRLGADSKNKYTWQCFCSFSLVFSDDPHASLTIAGSVYLKENLLEVVEMLWFSF